MGGDAPDIRWSDLRWATVPCLMFVTAMLSGATAIAIATALPVLTMLGPSVPSATLAVWWLAALMLGGTGCALAALAARQLTPDLVCVCSPGGWIDLHMHPAAFGFAAGKLRHAQAVRLLRALQGLSARRRPTAAAGVAPGDLKLRIVSQLCEARIMRRLGFAPSPTPAWKVLVLRAAFLGMTAIVRARRRRMVHRNSRNWTVTWTMTIGP